MSYELKCIENKEMAMLCYEKKKYNSFVNRYYYSVYQALLDKLKSTDEDLLKDINEKYDLIVANILADILLELIPDLDNHLNENGKIIFSGIDYLQLPKIEKALEDNNFIIKMKMQEGRWIGLLIARKPN